MSDIFCERLIEVREDLGLSQSAFADMIGVSSSTISRYEKSVMGVSLDVVGRISKKTGVNPGWLVGWNYGKYEGSRTTAKMAPIVGSIAAGTPLLAEENIEGYEYLDEADQVDFCLRIRGDSMIGAQIYDGDIVCIRRQETVENGEIAAVLIDDEATLKRVYVVNGQVILQAENPAYPDLYFSKQDQKDIKILGKAIWRKGEIR